MTMMSVSLEEDIIYFGLSLENLKSVTVVQLI